MSTVGVVPCLPVKEMRRGEVSVERAGAEARRKLLALPHVGGCAERRGGSGRIKPPPPSCNSSVRIHREERRWGAGRTSGRGRRRCWGRHAAVRDQKSSAPVKPVPPNDEAGGGSDHARRSWSGGGEMSGFAAPMGTEVSGAWAGRRKTRPTADATASWSWLFRPFDLIWLSLV